MKRKQKLVRNLYTGYKMVVEFVAIVNKVSYYVNVDNPENVYTELEIARL